jgi:mannose-6-phosphate isomerase-like protein (cupin superfamily)
VKVSLKHKTVEHKNGPTCTVIEHALHDDMADIAIAEISGRYPEKKRVVNKECNELAYVFEGKGKVVVNDKEQKLSAGDAIIIEAGEKYYWEGNMKLFLSCRPAWNVAQHRLVD